MTEHELFRKTFSTLHASPDTLMEVQKAMENNKKTHRTLRRGVVIAIAAALILADKTDVRRSRVRNKDMSTFDIHDRVNYSVERSEVLLDLPGRTVTLSLSINTEVCAVMDYFEIFLQRMLLSRKAAETLDLKFRLEINGQILL